MQDKYGRWHTHEWVVTAVGGELIRFCRICGAKYQEHWK